MSTRQLDFFGNEIPIEDLHPNRVHVDEHTRRPPRARGGDPVTSQIAASETQRKEAQRWLVLRTLARAPEVSQGYTDYEVSHILKAGRHVIARRRKDLEHDGFVEPVADLTRKTDTGALAQVHRITRAGRAALEAHEGS